MIKKSGHFPVTYDYPTKVMYEGKECVVTVYAEGEFYFEGGFPESEKTEIKVSKMEIIDVVGTDNETEDFKELVKKEILKKEYMWDGFDDYEG